MPPLAVTLRDFARRRFWPLLGGILLAAAAMRLPPAVARCLWTDELTTLEVIRMPWGALAENRLARGHFPFWFWGMKMWSAVFGESHLALRAPSLLANLAAVAALAFALRRRVGPGVALGAAALFAVHQRSVWSAVEARPYAATILFLVLSQWALVALTRRPSKRLAAGAIGASVAAASTHLCALPVLLFQALFAVACAPGLRRRGRAAPVVVAAGGGALYALLAALFLTRRTLAAGGVEAPRRAPDEVLRFFADGFAQVFAGEVQYLGGSSLRHVGEALGVLALAGAVATLRRRGPAPREWTLALLFWLAGPLTLYTILGATGALGETYRYFSPAVPAAMALLALTARLRADRRTLWIPVAGGLFIAAVGAGFALHPGDGLAAAAAAIRERGAPDSVTVAVTGGGQGETIFEYYGPAPGGFATLDRAETDPAAVAAALEKALGDAVRFQLFLYKEKNSPALDILRRDPAWRQTGEHRGENVRVVFFDRAATPR